MGLSRAAFERATISWKIVNLDPHIPEFKVDVYVVPKGYEWPSHPPYAQVILELVGKQPYKLEVVDVQDYGGIGNHKALGKIAKDALQQLNEGWYKPNGGKKFVLGGLRDDCMQKLTELKHGDPIRIGGKAWVVWRMASDRGALRSVTVFATRGKQTKLYQIVVRDVESCVVDLYLVNGMGDVIAGQDPVASGTLA